LDRREAPWPFRRRSAEEVLDLGDSEALGRREVRSLSLRHAGEPCVLRFENLPGQRGAQLRLLEARLEGGEGILRGAQGPKMRANRQASR